MNDNAFIKASKVEKEGEERLMKILSPMRKCIDLTEQRNCGDYFDEVKSEYHEFKFELSDKYGNFFLEHISNKSENIVGWIRKPMKAEYLWYGFLDMSDAEFLVKQQINSAIIQGNSEEAIAKLCKKRDDIRRSEGKSLDNKGKVYVFNFAKLQAWFRENEHKYEEKPQNKYKQHNDAWGKPVPIKTLQEAGLILMTLDL